MSYAANKQSVIPWSQYFKDNKLVIKNSKVYNFELRTVEIKKCGPNPSERESDYKFKPDKFRQVMN